LTRTYHVDPGYVTIPEANKIVLRILNIIDQGDKSHYNKILSGAKKGLYGGKKYGSRMYQVKREEIVQYAEESLQKEKLKLFNIEIVSVVNTNNKTIDIKTAKNLEYYLETLRFHDIITEEMYHSAKKNIMMRVNLSAIQNA
jgi:hypothetical protein